MQIDEVMGLIHEYTFANTTEADTLRNQIRAAIESLIAAPAAPQQATPNAREINDLVVKTALQQAEPVAYLYECMGRWAAHLKNGLRTADCAPPQYLIDAVNAATHPPAAEVQELRVAMHLAIDNLRRALEGGE